MLWFVILLILGLDPPDRQPPMITGVFPPGLTVGTRETWTISGHNLDQVGTVSTSGAGLTCGPVVVDPTGRSLRVEVTASPDAASTVREVRVDGPAGLSNLALVRVDRLRQVVEAEPNDQAPAPEQTIPVGTAVAGTIRPLDVDRFRVVGTPGGRVTLDWETRRLGTAIIPVLTVTGPGDRAILQARSQPGGDRDCRASVVIPPEGWFAVELRDNTYGGDDRARYRLRVEEVERPEGIAPIESPPASPAPIDPGPAGITIDGRVGRPGQVDRYRVVAHAGDRFRARVNAAASGSWLDSVLTITGPEGKILASNDDRPRPPGRIEPPVTIDGSPGGDSEVDLNIPEDGPITVEVADRYGAGGREYGYLLELGPPRDDLALFILPTERSSDPAPEARSLDTATAPTGPGAFGVFNVTPGSAVVVPFVLIPSGRPGTVEVRAEGLPDGVEAEPVLIRLAAAPRSGPRAALEWDAPPVVDSIRLRVGAEARPVRGAFRLMARTRPRNGLALERGGDRVVGVDAAGGPDRPVTRHQTELPIRVLASP